ncbi:tetratricopeptide repeat protein [bacterium]|nr:tetratricopeptide repeat protein [bacterium]
MENSQNQKKLFAPSFVGRQKELDLLLAQFSNFGKPKQDGIVLVEGENLTGKKELVKEFVKKAKNPEKPFLYTKATFLPTQVALSETNINDTYNKINSSQKGKTQLQKLHNVFVNDFENLTKGQPRLETIFQLAVVIRILAPILDSVSNPGKFYQNITDFLAKNKSAEPCAKAFQILKQVIFEASEDKTVVLALFHTENLPYQWKHFLFEDFLPKIQSEKKNVFVILTHGLLTLLESEVSFKTTTKIQKIQLQNLKNEEVSELLAKNISGTNEKFCEAVFEITHGNAGAIKILADTLINENKLTSSEISWKLETNWNETTDKFSTKTIEKLISEATQNEIANSEVTIETLNKWLKFAAMMGGNFSANIIAKAFGLAEDFLIDLFDEVLVYNKETKTGLINESGWINLKYVPHPNYHFADFLFWKHFREKISKDEVKEFAKLFVETLEKDFYVDREFFSLALEKFYDYLGDTENAQKFGEITKIRGHIFTILDTVNFLRSVNYDFKLGNFEEELFNNLNILIKKLSVPQTIEQNLQQIQQFLSEAEQLAEKLGSEKKVEIYLSQAIFLIQKSDFSGAESYLDKIETVGTKKKSVLATVGNLRGVILSNREKFEKALEIFDASGKLYTEINDLNGLASVKNSSGAVLMSSKKVEEGIAKFKEGLKILQDIGEFGGAAQSLQNLGSIYLHIRQPEKALEAFNESLEILKKLNNKPGIANSLVNIGSIYENGQNPEQAQEYFSKALEIMRELKDSNGIIKVLNFLGGSCSNSREFEKANKFYHEILQICREQNNEQGISYALNAIGTNFMNEGKDEKALNFLQQALSKFEEKGDKQSIGTVLNNLGNLHSKIEGKEKEALRCYTKAVELLTELNIKPALAYTFYNIGTVLVKQNDFTKASENFNLALKLHTETQDGQGVALALGQIGNLYKIQKDNKNALVNLISAFQIFQQIGSPNVSFAQKLIDEIGNEIGKVEFEKLIATINQEAEEQRKKMQS